MGRIQIQCVAGAAWVACGVAFAFIWIAAHIAWAALSLVPNLMANDSGQASVIDHLFLLGGMFGGQVIAGVAGIPGGLAFFWRGKRKLLLGLFALLFATGAGLQVYSFMSFFKGQ